MGFLWHIDYNYIVPITSSWTTLPANLSLISKFCITMKTTEIIVIWLRIWMWAGMSWHGMGFRGLGKRVSFASQLFAGGQMGSPSIFRFRAVCKSTEQPSPTATPPLRPCWLCQYWRRPYLFMTYFFRLLSSAERSGISGLCLHPLVVCVFSVIPGPLSWVQLIYILAHLYDLFSGPAHKRCNLKSSVAWTLFLALPWCLCVQLVFGLVGNAVGIWWQGELWAKEMLTTWENPIDTLDTWSSKSIALAVRTRSSSRPPTNLVDMHYDKGYIN